MAEVNETNIDNSFQDSGVPMRRFYLNRIKDETGVSRTGRVLEGVLTQSGHVIIQWRPPHSSIGIYGSLREFETIHVDCHPSCSEIVWLDENVSVELIDEVQQRADAVVDAAVAWHESGIEGDGTWGDTGEALATAIDRLLALRSKE